MREHEHYRASVYAPWIKAAAAPGLPPGDSRPIDQSYLVGPPEQLIEQIETYRSTTLPATDLIGWGTPVGMDPAEVTPSLERFAKEVIPHFRSR